MASPSQSPLPTQGFPGASTALLTLPSSTHPSDPGPSPGHTPYPTLASGPWSMLDSPPGGSPTSLLLQEDSFDPFTPHSPNPVQAESLQTTDSLPLTPLAPAVQLPPPLLPASVLPKVNHDSMEINPKDTSQSSCLTPGQHSFLLHVLFSHDFHGLTLVSLPPIRPLLTRFL